MKPFSIISSEGIRSAADVRIPDPTFSTFLKRLPVVPQDVFDNAKPMVSALRARNLVKEITFLDVLQELRRHPLSEPEAISCLKWWADLHKQRHDGDVVQGRSQLLDAARITVPEAAGKAERVVSLSSIRSFLNPRNMGSISVLRAKQEDASGTIDCIRHPRCMTCLRPRWPNSWPRNHHIHLTMRHLQETGPEMYDEKEGALRLSMPCRPMESLRN